MEEFSTIGFDNPIVLSLDFDGITIQTPIILQKDQGCKIHGFQ